MIKKYLIGVTAFSFALLVGISSNSNKPPITGFQKIDQIASYTYSNGEKGTFEGLRYFEFQVNPNLFISYYPYQELGQQRYISFPFLKIEEYSNNVDGISVITKDCGRRLDSKLLGTGFFESSDGCQELVDKVFSKISSQ